MLCSDTHAATLFSSTENNLGCPNARENTWMTYYSMHISMIFWLFLPTILCTMVDKSYAWTMKAAQTDGSKLNCKHNRLGWFYLIIVILDTIILWYIISVVFSWL